MKPKFKIIIIFVIALVLRLIFLDKNPTFISDEASIGYNAYSILKTGRDEWNNFFPLVFKSFGEYKLPLYIYLSIPTIAIFGLNELGVRLPSALIGSLTVIALFYLVKQLLLSFSESNFRDRSAIPILSSLLLAISPWHIQLSRLALEANVALFMTILAATYLLKAIKNHKYYYVSFILFVLTLYTYNSCRVFVPLFLIGYFLFYKNEIVLSKIVKPFIFTLIFLIPLFVNGFSGSQERLYKVGIFNDQGIIAKINEGRGKCLSTKPQFLCLVIYNKPVFYPLALVKNYLSHFAPDYLFIKGAGLAQYGVPEQGVLYFWELPFILLGIIFLYRFKKAFLLLFLWISIAPIANSLTGTAHPVRAILMLPVFLILSACGLFYSFNLLKERKYFNKIYLFLIILVVLTSFCVFTFKYFVLYPIISDWNWQMGYKQLFAKLASQDAKYNKIYISKFYGEPHIFYLFYTKFDPLKYQKGEGVIRYDREDQWVNVDQIGKYYFAQEPQKINLEENELLVLPYQEFSFNTNIVDVVKYKDGKTAFLITKK